MCSCQITHPHMNTQIDTVCAIVLLNLLYLWPVKRCTNPFPSSLWLLANYGTVSPRVSTVCISELVKQSCQAQTNPWHPLAIPQDRPALTGPCCPAPDATTITVNIFISRTDGLQASIFSRSQRREGMKKRTGDGKQTERQTSPEKERKKIEREKKNTETGCQGAWVTGVIRSIMVLLWGAWPSQT